jgi:hypothetical protein
MPRDRKPPKATRVTGQDSRGGCARRWQGMSRADDVSVCGQRHQQRKENEPRHPARSSVDGLGDSRNRPRQGRRCRRGSGDQVDRHALLGVRRHRRLGPGRFLVCDQVERHTRLGGRGNARKGLLARAVAGTAFVGHHPTAAVPDRWSPTPRRAIEAVIRLPVRREQPVGQSGGLWRYRTDDDSVHAVVFKKLPRCPVRAGISRRGETGGWPGARHASLPRQRG